jgi:DNA-binding FrmR family transcriptional regulator
LVAAAEVAELVLVTAEAVARVEVLEEQVPALVLLDHQGKDMMEVLVQVAAVAVAPEQLAAMGQAAMAAPG